MKIQATVTAVALLASGCATGAPDIVEYGCSDLVAIVRIETADEMEAQPLDAPPASDAYFMQLRIKRVLRGQEPRRVVPAVAGGHAQLRQDVDFWMVLRPEPNGGYSVMSANGARHPYSLAPTCN